MLIITGALHDRKVEAQRRSASGTRAEVSECAGEVSTSLVEAHAHMSTSAKVLAREVCRLHGAPAAQKSLPPTALSLPRSHTHLSEPPWKTRGTSDLLAVVDATISYSYTASQRAQTSITRTRTKSEIPDLSAGVFLPWFWDLAGPRQRPTALRHDLRSSPASMDASMAYLMPSRSAEDIVRALYDEQSTVRTLFPPEIGRPHPQPVLTEVTATTADAYEMPKGTVRLEEENVGDADLYPTPTPSCLAPSQGGGG